MDWPSDASGAEAVDCFYCSIIRTTIPLAEAASRPIRPSPVIPEAEARPRAGARLSGTSRCESNLLRSRIGPLLADGSHRSVRDDGCAVARGAPARDAARCADQALQVLGAQLLAVHGTGGARDGFVHEHAAHVVGSGRKAQRRAVGPHLHPRGLDVDHEGIERQAGDGVHEHGLAEGRALAGAALQVDGRLHVHERQRHELGEAAGPLLQRADALQVARPVAVAVDVAEHDGGGALAGRPRAPSP